MRTRRPEWPAPDGGSFSSVAARRAVALVAAVRVVAAAVALVAAAATAGRLLVGRHTHHLLSSGEPAPAVADPAAPDLAATEVLVERLELAGQRLELADSSPGVGQLVGD